MLTRFWQANKHVYFSRSLWKFKVLHISRLVYWPCKHYAYFRSWPSPFYLDIHLPMHPVFTNCDWSFFFFLSFAFFKKKKKFIRLPYYLSFKRFRISSREHKQKFLLINAVKKTWRLHATQQRVPYVRHKRVLHKSSW